MAAYVVMEPPGRGVKADATTLVRDGFNWVALLVPPLWFAWHRLWIEAGIAFVVMGALSMLGQYFGLGLPGSLLSLLVSLYVGLEGQGLRIAALRRRGWHEWGVVEAATLDDADMRQALESEQPADEIVPAPRMIPDAALARASQPGIALGLTHVPGRS
ncbi:DUF2628 domain-containing protein [Mesorhizobium sp. ES1-1]|uniref:DUF2628 domain-containing protein n=1 Tax=Mesorhizobium sp. ES1-1 TaxID=2876629 RepID=UPI001CCC4C55|nr:DUF2628 domain-containing protein [Mesorhizobium sp. ES1-1]MBZ9676678.1 DUF2628 domain-containing protein [Mesorhizobium sp. ES1-1]